MARFAASCDIVAGFVSGAGAAADVVNSADTSTDSAAVTTAATAVASAVTVLVDDGATPTEAHVTTLAAAWTTLAAAITTLQGDLAQGSAANPDDVILSFEATSVVTNTQLRQAAAALLQVIQGSNALTP